jgi:hypothetical protein
MESSDRGPGLTGDIKACVPGRPVAFFENDLCLPLG